jgi:hypothetical protein
MHPLPDIGQTESRVDRPGHPAYSRDMQCRLASGMGTSIAVADKVYGRVHGSRTPHLLPAQHWPSRFTPTPPPTPTTTAITDCYHSPSHPPPLAPLFRPELGSGAICCSGHRKHGAVRGNGCILREYYYCRVCVLLLHCIAVGRTVQC